MQGQLQVFLAVNYLDILYIIETPNGPVMYTPSSPKKCWRAIQTDETFVTDPNANR